MTVEEEMRYCLEVAAAVFNRYKSKLNHDSRLQNDLEDAIAKALFRERRLARIEAYGNVVHEIQGTRADWDYGLVDDLQKLITAEKL